MVEDYQKILERGISAIPCYRDRKERFRIPEFDSEISGNKTIIRNFQEVAAYLCRNKNHLLKFLFRELGSKGSFDKKFLVIHGKFTNIFVNKKLAEYCSRFVICPKCGKPDTRIISEDAEFLKCEACGNKKQIEKI